MAKNNRVVDNKFLQDSDQIKSVEYNPAAGAQKSLIVGPRLLPIQISGGYTTNVAAGVNLPFVGANLAIYNNSGTAGSVTVGDALPISTPPTALAIGAVDSAGHVGVACTPNTWTYLSMGAHQYIISSASTIIVYVIEDPTTIAQESSNYAQQNAPIQPVS